MFWVEIVGYAVGVVGLLLTPGWLRRIARGDEDRFLRLLRWRTLAGLAGFSVGLVAAIVLMVAQL